MGSYGHARKVRPSTKEVKERATQPDGEGKRDPRPNVRQELVQTLKYLKSVRASYRRRDLLKIVWERATVLAQLRKALSDFSHHGKSDRA